MDTRSGQLLVKTESKTAYTDVRFSGDGLSFIRHSYPDSDHLVEFYQFDPTTKTEKRMHHYQYNRLSDKAQSRPDQWWGTVSRDGKWVYYQENIDTPSLNLFSVESQKVLAQVKLPAGSVAKKPVLDKANRYMAIPVVAENELGNNWMAKRLLIAQLPTGEVLQDVAIPHIYNQLVFEGDSVLLSSGTMMGKIDIATGKSDWKALLEHETDLRQIHHDGPEVGIQFRKNQEVAHSRFVGFSHEEDKTFSTLPLEDNEVPNGIRNGMLISSIYKTLEVAPWQTKLNLWSYAVLKRMVFPPTSYKVKYRDLQTGETITSFQLNQSQSVSSIGSFHFGKNLIAHLYPYEDGLRGEIHTVFPFWTLYRILGAAFVASGLLWWWKPWRLVGRAMAAIAGSDRNRKQEVTV